MDVLIAPDEAGELIWPDQAGFPDNELLLPTRSFRVPEEEEEEEEEAEEAEQQEEE